MKYAIVHPAKRMIEIVDVGDARDAKVCAGLDPLKTDHGTVLSGLGYICGEHAMFVHPQFYFGIGRKLYAGNVVLFAYAPDGRTVDYMPPSRWFGAWIGDDAAAEAAIKAGRIDRPQMAIDGEVFWQWPAPKPDMEEFARRVAELSKDSDVMIDDVLISKDKQQ